MNTKHSLLVVCIMLALGLGCSNRPSGVPAAPAAVAQTDLVRQFEADGWSFSAYCYSDNRDQVNFEVHYPNSYEFVQCYYHTGGITTNCDPYPEEFMCRCNYFPRDSGDLSILLMRGSAFVTEKSFPVSSIIPTTCLGDPGTWNLWAYCEGGTSGPMTALFEYPAGYDVVMCNIVDQDGTNYACESRTYTPGAAGSCACNDLPRTTTDLHPLLSLADGTSIQMDIPTSGMITTGSCPDAEPTARPGVGGGVTTPANWNIDDCVRSEELGWNVFLMRFPVEYIGHVSGIETDPATCRVVYIDDANNIYGLACPLGSTPVPFEITLILDDGSEYSHTYDLTDWWPNCHLEGESSGGTTGGGTQPGGGIQPGGGGQQPPTGCGVNLTYDACKTAGCYWWSDNTCHDIPEPICTYTDQKSCEGNSCYWWSGGCHANPFNCFATYGTDKTSCLNDLACDWDGTQCFNTP